MQGMAVMSWKAWHPSNTCHTSSHNFRPLQSSPESSWNFPGMQFHFERKVMRSFIWDILMKFECSGKRTWPKYKGVESRETANGRPPNAYQRCSNGGMVVGPAICVQEFLVGFTYSVPFLWEIWPFLFICLFFVMFRNQLICRGDFGFCCDILVLCLSWPLVIKTCYDNFVNRQNEVWFIQGWYPFSYTILLKRAFNQFIQLGQ